MELAENVWQYLTACWTTIYLLPATCFPAAEFQIHDRRFRVVKQLGEGGYSYIYLVKEIPTVDQPFMSERFFAVKMMNLGSQEQMRLAEAEIEILSELNHPHIIQMISSCIHETSDEHEGYRGFMLFPCYKEGSVADLVGKLYESGCRLSPFSVLDIFRQVCEAVQYLHEAGYCHRDIKPHNILIEHQNQNGFHSRTADDQALLLACIPEVSDEEVDSIDLTQDSQYNAVLADFGSVGPSQIIIENRQQSLQLQEEIAVLSSMPYRAPELFDVPSPTVIDEKIDTWSLGCTLYESTLSGRWVYGDRSWLCRYFLMYGTSPFERVMAESGGSLPLAIANGRIQWPKPPLRHYPSEIHALVVTCLDVNPQTRPLTSELISRVRTILTNGVQNNQDV